MACTPLKPNAKHPFNLSDQVKRCSTDLKESHKMNKLLSQDLHREQVAHGDAKIKLAATLNDNTDLKGQLSAQDRKLGAVNADLSEASGALGEITERLYVLIEQVHPTQTEQVKTLGRLWLMVPERYQRKVREGHEAPPPSLPVESFAGKMSFEPIQCIQERDG